MKIVSDRGMDLAPEQLKNLDVSFAPLRLSLDGKTYASGIDLQPDEFYDLLSKTDSFPTTSQPSSGEFAEIYRDLAKSGEEILSVHISSGLSGTLNSAKLGAQMVPEAKVNFFDSLTLSCPLGWQVEAAARAARAGWSIEQVTAKLNEIKAKANGIYTLATLKYLIHGGRISHIKGLVASVLNVKPIITVEKERGTYVTLGQDFTLNKAVVKLVDLASKWYAEGTKLRVQPLHGKNPESAAMIVEEMKKRFDLVLEPLTSIAPVLGAHTGPTMVGMAVGPASIFEGIG
jgi:fatty acid kinase fatty acid binding subunit